MSGIRLFEPSIGKEEEDIVVETLRSGYWASGSGEGKVKEFEESLRKYLGCKHVICVNSGTAALHLAISLFPQKRVLLPSLSFVSTANAVLYNNKEVLFEDVNPSTLTMRYFSLQPEDTINLPVHYAGYPVNVESNDICTVVEDCAHAIGSKLTTKNIKCFSFHPTKNLATIGGGAIALYDDQYVDELKEKRWCGIANRKGDKYEVNRLGYNYYMNEIAAAMGIEGLKKLDKNNRRRYEIAKEYDSTIGQFYDCIPLTKDCSYHLYWILVENRDKFRKKLASKGIETGTHYYPIDKFRLYKQANLPITHKIAKEIVTLPNHPNLSDSDVDKVIKVANS